MLLGYEDPSLCSWSMERRPSYETNTSSSGLHLRPAASVSSVLILKGLLDYRSECTDAVWRVSGLSLRVHRRSVEGLWTIAQSAQTQLGGSLEYRLECTEAVLGVTGEMIELVSDLNAFI